MSTIMDPILVRFRAALAATYGARLARVVLFGSRARGDHRQDSDYDIAVFLAQPDSLGMEARRLAEIGTSILVDTGAVINALPLDAATYMEASAFMAGVRREGFNL